jgi:hypothetical protein
MNLPQLQNEIISCIWSRALKTHIAEKGYTFTDEELLGIAFHFAPTFDERLRLLQLLAAFAPSVSDHASRCIDWQTKSLQQFRQSADHEIYELRIKDEPDAYEERYLCASFDIALEMIDQFYQEYDFATETPQARYVIEKRKILQPGQTFCEDSLGECVLAAGKVLISVDPSPEESENGRCCHSCVDCATSCVLNLDVCFPAFIPDRSPVMYLLPDGSTHYGILLALQEPEIIEACYIIPLDCEMMKHKRYDKAWGYHWHEHIPCPYVEPVQETALTPELLESYQSFVTWLETKSVRI